MESPLNLPKSDSKISKIIPKFQNHPYKNYTKTETNHLHLGSASPVKAASVASAQASWDKPPISWFEASKIVILYVPWRIHGAAIYGTMDLINIPPLC